MTEKRTPMRFDQSPHAMDVQTVPYLVIMILMRVVPDGYCVSTPSCMKQCVVVLPSATILSLRNGVGDIFSHVIVASTIATPTLAVHDKRGYGNGWVNQTRDIGRMAEKFKSEGYSEPLNVPFRFYRANSLWASFCRSQGCFSVCSLLRLCMCKPAHVRSRAPNRLQRWSKHMVAKREVVSMHGKNLLGNTPTACYGVQPIAPLKLHGSLCTRDRHERG